MSVTPEIIQRSIEIVREFKAKKLILFGSALDTPEVARDLDLACEGVEGWDIFRLGARLESELQLPVDLVPLRDGDRFSSYISRTGRVIYDAE
ncbi:MAG: nucleotidyltransferase domain-containing protein [Planctomycetota bacterium]|nr:nucleotidyltransferase domain-containing protein [Planctomycetota bacterium]